MNPLDRNQDELDPGDRKLLKDVQESGFHIVMIPATPPVGHEEHTSDIPEWITAFSWAFTVGLFHTFGHPEVIIFGLPDDQLARLPAMVGERVRSGETFQPNLPYEGLLPDRPVMFIPAQAQWYGAFLGYALWFYREGRFPVHQILWPDDEGRFPWDPSSRSREAQPNLAQRRPSNLDHA